MENKPKRQQTTLKELKSNFNHNSVEIIKAIKLIKTFLLRNPIELFRQRIKRCCNLEKKHHYKIVPEPKETSGKLCCDWLLNIPGPLFGSEKFAMPKQILGIEEPSWLTSRTEFLNCLPDTEGYFILTGNPNLKLDPYTYI
jgi:hypothetical protein